MSTLEDKFYMVTEVIACIEIFIEVAVVITVIVRLLKTAKISLHSFYVKLIMSAYLIMTLYLTTCAIIFVIVEQKLHTLMHKWLGHTIFDIGYFIWNLIHWAFTFHFLSVACLFKMTF